MVVIVSQFVGWLAFVIGTLVLGVALRRNPSQEFAENTSRMVHFLYFAGVVFPGVLAIFHPGLDRLDELLGIPSLPFKPIAFVAGTIFLLIGLYFTLTSNKALRQLGRGTNAFILTQQIVAGDIYQRTRDPMSLGYYLICVGIGLVAGSTYITLGSLIALIPAHLFFLKYFEELELELRFGESYRQYRRIVPFLIPKWR